MTITRKLTMIFFLVTIPFLLKGQELITDRPDQTTSSSTVPRGTFQWEAGSVLQTDRMDTTRRTSFIPLATLFRYGLFERLELRLGTEFTFDKIKTNVSTPREFSFTEKGLYPVYFGLKYQFLDQHSIIPEMALVAHLSIPQLATHVDAPDKVAPDVTLAASHTFRYRFTTGYNFGLIWDAHYTLPTIFWSAVLGIRHSLLISSYYEIYGFVPPEANADDLRMDAGLTWLIRPNFQLDTSAGLGITEDAPDLFVSLGFSWRIPQ